MADRSHSRPAAETIAADRAILQAMANLSDYAPVQSSLSYSAVKELEATLVAAQQYEERIQREAATAREQAIAAAWSFHEAVQGVKIQVEAQYGSDSTALHVVGLKRRSERKRGRRKKTDE